MFTYIVCSRTKLISGKDKPQCKREQDRNYSETVQEKRRDGPGREGKSRQENMVFAQRTRVLMCASHTKKFNETFAN